MLHNENKNIWWFLCFSSVTILWTLVLIILRVFNVISWSAVVVLLPLLIVSVFSFIILNVVAVIKFSFSILDAVAVMKLRENISKEQIKAYARNYDKEQIKAYARNYFSDGKETEFFCVDNLSKEELLDKLSSNIRV